MKNKSLVPINIRCPKEIRDKLDILADRENIPRSSLVNMILTRYIRENEEKDSVAKAN